MVVKINISYWLFRSSTLYPRYDLVLRKPAILSLSGIRTHYQKIESQVFYLCATAASPGLPNFSQQDKNWAELSTLEVAALKLRISFLLTKTA
jgi:hypothetical protein